MGRAVGAGGSAVCAGNKDGRRFDSVTIASHLFVTFYKYGDTDVKRNTRKRNTDCHPVEPWSKDGVLMWLWDAGGCRRPPP